MPGLYQRFKAPPAQAPGTVEYHGERLMDDVEVRCFRFGPDLFEEHGGLTGEESPETGDQVAWVDLKGLHDVGMLKMLGERFGIHPLVLEDVVNTQHRPKLEVFRDYLYVVVRTPTFEAGSGRVVTDQVSVVIGRGYVLSFLECSRGVIEPVRERLRRGAGRMRSSGAGYLGYALLDAVVDRYFRVLEELGNEIEKLEEELLSAPASGILERIHVLKRETLVLRRAVWPLRELVADLGRDDEDLVGEEVEPFLRDLHDHVLAVTETVDSFREILSGLQDLYLSSVSLRMNDVMKVLTIITTIFVPLTFVAGVYGMNFLHMPGLAWRWSFALFWGGIAVIGWGMFAFFRRRKWL